MKVSNDVSKYVLSLAFFAGTSLFTQAQTIQQKDTISFEPKALELSEIPKFGQATRKLNKDIDALVLQQDNLTNIDTEISEADPIIENKLTWLRDTITVYKLDKLEKEETQLTLLKERADQWQVDIQKWIEETEQSNDSIAVYRQVWRLTLDSLIVKGKTEIDRDSAMILSMNKVQERIRSNQERLTAMEKTLIPWWIQLRATESYLTVTLGELNEALLLLDSKRQMVINQIWVPQYEPIWSIKQDSLQTKPTLVIKQQHLARKTIIQNFLQSNPQFLQAISLLFILILTTLLYIKKRIRKKPEIIHDQFEVTTVLKYPIISTLILLWFLIFLFFDIPKELHRTLLLFMMLPFAFMLWQLFEKNKWKKTNAFILGYLVFITIPYISELSFLFRISLLLIDLISLGILLKLYQEKELVTALNSYWLGALPFLIYCFTGLSIISILANSIGNVQIAYLLTLAMLGTFLSFMILKQVIFLARGFVYITLLTPLYEYSNILKEDREFILKKMSQLLTLFGYASWIYIILDLLKIRNWVTSGFINIINAPLTIGKMSITLGNILAFYIIMQVTIWLSSAIRYILEKEVYPRVQLREGVSSTISLMVRYTIYLLGFVLALAGAGIDPGKVAIGMGALGVGIGFGLQNIVNNFISGIILALERPIKIGDVLQIGDISGTVKDIGLRASQIKTWDGADVLVPNGDLVSNKLTNWTFSDRKRRIHIEIRIPSETNMEEVSNLILKTTNNIEGLLKKPRPYLFYKGLTDGASVINVYAWIKNLDLILLLETRFRTTIYKTLQDAGYTISVPKMDIAVTQISEDSGVSNNDDPAS